MSKASLKQFFRTQLKVVPGGPPVGTPGANRTAGVLAALDKVVDEAVEVPTNLQFGGPFLCTHLHSEEGPGAALLAIPADKLCIGAFAMVEFAVQDGITYRNQCYYIAYDDSTTPQYQVTLDGTGTGGKLGGKWVREGSQEAANAVVPRWSNTLAGLLADKSLVKILFAGDSADSFFTAQQAGGPFPAPVKNQTDAYWRPVGPPPPTLTQAPRYLPISLTDAQAQDAASTLIPTVDYYVTGAWNGVANTTLKIHALNTRLEATGVLIGAGNGPGGVVSVNLAAGTYTALSVDAYTKAQSDARFAKPADIAAIVGAAPAALDTLAEIAAQLQQDEQGAAAMLATQQQHTQQIVLNSAAIIRLGNEKMPTLVGADSLVTPASGSYLFPVAKLNQTITVYNNSSVQETSILLPNLTEDDGTKLVLFKFSANSGNYPVEQMRLVIGYDVNGGNTVTSQVITLLAYDEVTVVGRLDTSGYRPLMRWLVLGTNRAASAGGGGTATPPDADLTTNPASTTRAASVKAVNDGLATVAAGLGAPQWVAGKQAAGQLVYNDTAVWRVKQAISNSQAGPTHAAPNAANYEYLGGPEVLTALATVGQHTQQIAALQANGQLTPAQVVALNPLTFPVMGLKASLTGYASLEAAIDAYEAVVTLNQSVKLAATTSFFGFLRSTGARLAIADGESLKIYSGTTLNGVGIDFGGPAKTGYVEIIGSSGTSTAVTAIQATQFVDCEVGVPVLLSDTNGQGITLRGKTKLTAIQGQGQLYVYDLASYASKQAGIVLSDRRPGAASGGGAAYTAGTGIAISSSNVISATGSAGAGIDYANPVTLTQATVLAINKAYHVTGSGYQLTLPDAATAGGGGIFIEIASDATGLFPLSNGSSLRLYAGETMLLRATPSGWKKAGGEQLPMVARLETTVNQQDYYNNVGITHLPLSVRPTLSGPEALASAASGTITIQRDGRAVFGAGGVFSNLSDPAVGYTVLLRRTSPGGAASYPIVVFCVNGKSGSDLLAVCPPLSPALPVLAGEVYDLTMTTGAGASCRMAGQAQTNVFYLQFTEIV